MKKLIIVSVLVLAACAIAFASPNAAIKRKPVIDNPNEVATSSALTPSQKITGGAAKFAGTFIDSSRNAFGLYQTRTEPIVMFNDSLAFVFRQYPTSSGRLACASSGDFGASWVLDYDINSPLTTCRYPSAVGGLAPYAASAKLEGGAFGSGIAVYNVGGWLSQLWDPYVQAFPDLGIAGVSGCYLNDGNVMLVADGNTVYKALFSGDLTTEITAATPIWDDAAGDTAFSVNADYRFGRLIQMSSVYAPWSPYQYVKSDDNGATGFTGADTVTFNLAGLADSSTMYSRMVINKDSLPVMVTAVVALADTMDGAWSGAFIHCDIICALPTGEHVTIYNCSGSNGTGEGVGAVVAMARAEGDTLIAGWMQTSDASGYASNTINWDIMMSISYDGGHTWKTPITVVNTPIAECFPHFAINVGSDRKVHMVYGTTNSTTTNLDLYCEAYLGAGTAVGMFNYWVAVSIDELGVAGNTTSTPAYKLALNQSNPNPARTNASISFSLPKSGNYSLKIYNIAGQVIRTLDGKGTAGQNTVTWNGMDNSGRKVANGVYLYNLQAFGNSATKKLVVVR